MNNIKNSTIFFKNIKGRLASITFMYVLIGILSFITPILTANLLASLIYNNFNYTVQYAILVAITYIFQELILYTSEHIWNINIRPRILHNVRQYIISNILSLKVSVMDKYGDGLIEERIEDDPNDVARIVNTLQRNSVNVITKIGIIIYIIISDYRISIVYIVGMLLVEYIDTIKHKRVKLKDEKLNNSETKASSFIGEVVEGMRDIKTLNIERKIQSHLSNKLNIVANNISEKDICHSTYDKIERVILYITMALVIVLGMYLLNTGRTSVVNLLIMYLYQNDVFSLMSEISLFRTNIKDYNSIIEKILQLDDERIFQKEKFGKVSVNKMNGKIKFDNVYFAYDKKNILNGMSFEIKEKENIALVGTPECGKTTIANLLIRNYDCNSGSITIDDIAIENLNEESLKKYISVVNQDSYIFNMSIKDNLLLVKSDATKKELDFVCQKADIYNYIMSLPDKYNTIVGMDGVNLSSGQRQKLAIARALLQGSQILIFDEATSSIDNVSQSEIQDSINNLVKEKTIITISHRLSATSKCDRILVIDKGKIVAEGSHKNLITNCKVYKNLYKDINKN